MAELRSLIVVLGAQLDLDAAACDAFDAGVDSKPCIATGKYIHQCMSPHCKDRRHEPAQHSGASSCPFTTLC